MRLLDRASPGESGRQSWSKRCDARLHRSLVLFALVAPERSHVVLVVPILLTVPALLRVLSSKWHRTVWTRCSASGRARLASMNYPCFAILVFPTCSNSEFRQSHPKAITGPSELAYPRLNTRVKLGKVTNLGTALWAFRKRHGSIDFNLKTQGCRRTCPGLDPANAFGINTDHAFERHS